MVFPHGQGMRRLSQCGYFADKGGGRVTFSRFCADVFYGRSLIENVIFSQQHFYKNTRLIFVQSLRTIPGSAEEQSLKFSILEQILAVNVVYKIL